MNYCEDCASFTCDCSDKKRIAELEARVKELLEQNKEHARFVFIDHARICDQLTAHQTALKVAVEALEQWVVCCENAEKIRTEKDVPVCALAKIKEKLKCTSLA